MKTAAVSATSASESVPTTAGRTSAPVVRELPPEPTRTVVGDFREIVSDMLGVGDLLRQLVRRDITVRYKQAAFGFAWALLVPVSIILAGLTLRLALAHAAGRSLNLDQVAGMTVKSVPWAFFSGCLTMGTPSLVANMSLVTKIYFPRETLPLAAVLAQSFDSSIGLVLVTLVLPFLGVHLSWALLWVPLLLGLLWVFALAMALILSCANLFFRDVKYIVQVFLTFGIFATPVLLDAPQFGRLGCRLLMLNPVAPILEGLRLSIVNGHNLLTPLAAPQGFAFWTPWLLAYSAAASFGFLAISALIFHRAEQRFAEFG